MQLNILGNREPIERSPLELRPGAWFVPNFLSLDEQNELLEWVKNWAKTGWYTPAMPDGTPMNHPIAGLGFRWVPYEYHKSPQPFPARLHFLARRAVRTVIGEAVYPDFAPDACIINWYPPGSSLSLHQDRSEDRSLQTAGSPIVTIALGDAGICRQGNCRDRNGPFNDFEMHSGDLWILSGPSRMAYHAMLRVLPGTAPSGLDWQKAGRVSLTIRQVLAR